MNRIVIGIGLAALGLCFLTGCESKFKRDRFDMIRIGMDTREDVRHLLGDPEGEMQNIWLYDDLDDHKSAQIFFDDDGRVLAKEWMDAETGEWSGDNPHTNPPPKGEVRESETRTRRIDD